MARYIGLFVLLGTLLVSGTHAQNDPCALPTLNAQYWFGKISDVATCFNSIPYGSDRAAATIAQLRLMTDLYSFTDIASQNLAPWNIDVDLNSAINAIESASYSSEYSFHVAISNLLNSLQDAHTRYVLPAPFRRGFVLRPFGLQVTNNNGNMKFMTIAPLLGQPSEFQSAFSFDPTLYYNQEVTSIDGQSPFTWLKSYANDYCRGYKDEKVRFNVALGAYGCFVAYDGSLNSITNVPASHSMVIGGKTVSVPNMAILFQGVYNSEYATIELTASSRKRLSAEFGSFVTPDIHREHKQRLQALVNPNATEYHTKTFNIDYSTLNTRQSKGVATKRLSIAEPQVLEVKTSNVNNIDFSLTTSDYTLWRALLTTVSGNNIPLLRVESFLPSSADDFIALVDDFAEQLAQNKFDAVMIDVSGNGGGYICLANFLLATFVEDFTGSNTYGKYDLRRSDLNSRLVTSQAISSSDYLKLGTTIKYSPSDLSWYDARPSTRDVTQLVHYPSDCQDLFAQVSPKRKFFPKNIVIVTDGSCGSACALFVAKMEQAGKAKIVTHGGTTDGPSMSSSSFAGGNVIDWKTLVSVAAVGASPPISTLPTSATLSFSHHEVYLSNEDVPLEFLFSPAQYHVYYWDAISNGDISTDAGILTRVNLYETASQAFGSISQKSSANHVTLSGVILGLLAVALLC